MTFIALIYMNFRWWFHHLINMIACLTRQFYIRDTTQKCYFYQKLVFLFIHFSLPAQWLTLSMTSTKKVLSWEKSLQFEFPLKNELKRNSNAFVHSNTCTRSKFLNYKTLIIILSRDQWILKKHSSVYLSTTCNARLI